MNTVPKYMSTAVTVIPTRSAAVAANFIAHVGYRAMLQLSGIKGLAIPFGAMVSVDNASISGIVDDTGTVYLAGVPRQFSITVKWGKAPEQQCHAAVDLPEPRAFEAACAVVDEALHVLRRIAEKQPYLMGELSALSSFECLLVGIL